MYATALLFQFIYEARSSECCNWVEPLFLIYRYAMHTHIFSTCSRTAAPAYHLDLDTHCKPGTFEEVKGEVWLLLINRHQCCVCFKCQIRINRNAIVYWIYSAIVNCNLLITDPPIKRDEICLGDHSQGVCTEEKTTNSDPERVFNTLGGVLISRQTSSHKKRKLDLFVKYWENAILYGQSIRLVRLYFEYYYYYCCCCCLLTTADMWI